MAKVKREINLPGIRTDKDHSMALDYFRIWYDQEMDSLKIQSHNTGEIYSVNMDSMIDFIEKNKEIIFEDF